MRRRPPTHAAWPLALIFAIGAGITSCAEKGAVGVTDAALDAPALDAPSLDSPDGDGSAFKDTWIPDIFAWFRVDAMGVDFPQPVDIPPVSVDVPTCTPQSVVECVCPDGRSGLQPCTEFGYFGACRCVASPPPTTASGPRLLRPFSGLRSMTQRPTFRWALPEGVTRARIELCEDRACTRRITQADLTGSAWRPMDTLRPGVIFWHVSGLRADGTVAWTSATWAVGIRHRDTPVDSAWGPLKDFNGDGLDDLVAIAYRTADRDQVMSGPTPGIYVMSGSRTTLLEAPITIPSELDVLGRRVAIGDVNGDGLADIALASAAPDPGAVSVHLGRRDGRISERSVLLVGDNEVREDYASAIAITDFDGDGFGDLIVIGATEAGDVVHPNVWIYPGSAIGLQASVAHTTYSRVLPAYRNEDHHATEVGDLDGDGYGDFAVMRFDGSSAIAYGNPGGEPGARAAATEFANALARRRTGMFGMDVDGDGVTDLAMGYPRRVARGYQGSLIRVEEVDFGIRSADDRWWTWYDRSRISRPADYDGDGRADLVETLLCTPKTGPSRCGETSLRLFRGRGGFFPAIPDWRVDVTTNTFAGSPGDLDGDGFDDLVVADETRLTVYLGRIDTLERQPGAFTTPAPIRHSSMQPLL